MTDKELIEQVAVKFMGWHKGDDQYGTYCWVDENNKHAADLNFGYPFNPITNANHLMMIIDKLKTRQGMVKLIYQDITGWRVTIVYDGLDGGYYHTEHESISYAVCLVAIEIGIANENNNCRNPVLRGLRDGR